MKWTIPAPNDRPLGRADAPEVVLIGRVMSTVRDGGPELTVDSTVFEMWLGAVREPTEALARLMQSYRSDVVLRAPYQGFLVNRCPRPRSIARHFRSSSTVTNVTASPERPMRPVLPARWVNNSSESGRS